MTITSVVYHTRNYYSETAVYFDIFLIFKLACSKILPRSETIIPEDWTNISEYKGKYLVYQGWKCSLIGYRISTDLVN